MYLDSYKCLHFLGAVYKSVMDQCHNKTAVISRLQSEIREQQETLARKRKEGNAHKAQLMVYTTLLCFTQMPLLLFFRS
jgi:hypothetical protein